MTTETIEAPVDTTTPPADTTTSPAVVTPPISSLAKPVALADLIPEKFRVKNGEEFDADASTRKVLESYKAMEQRVGSGDLPPKSAEEYTVAVPDELKDTLKDFKLSPEFLKGAHEVGITQKGLDFMLANYFKEAPALISGGVQNSVDAVIGSLDKSWGGEYDKNLAGAMKAFDAYAEGEDKGKFDEIMTNPALAYRILAKIAPELGEPGSVPRSTEGTSEDSVQALLTDPVLQNSKHPEYAAKRAKVDAYYAKKYGTASVS